MRTRLLLLMTLLFIFVPLLHAQENYSGSAQANNKILSSQNDTVDVIITFADSPKTRKKTFFSMFKAGQDAGEMTREKIRQKGKLKREFSIINSISATIPKTMLAELENDPDILSVELDRRVHAFLGQSVPLIGADDAWDMQITGDNLTGKGTTVCIIDTGIDYTHQDLGNCTLWSTEGNIVSHPLESLHPYADNTTVNWTITKPGFSNIAVHFVNIGLETGYDKIQILDKNDILLEEYSQNYTDIWSVSASGDTIKIRLIADPYINDYGFYIDEVINGTASYSWDNCSKVIGGWDFVNNDNDPADDNDHGTHVAGIVAANGIVKGVAPDAGLIAIKALDKDGSGYDSDIVAGIEWCVSNASIYNISVISMSLGDESYYDSYCDDESTAMTDAINAAVAKNITVAIASGNVYPPAGISFPACIENATRVGSTSKSDTIENYTQRGINFSDMLLAPGGNIYSTLASNTYGSKSGTSMATPHVSGTATLIVQAYLQKYGTRPTPAYIKDILNKTGKPIYDNATGLNFSRIDAYSAVSHINTPPQITGKYNNKTHDNSTQILADETDSLFFNISASAPVNYSWHLNTTPLSINRDNWTFNTGYNDSGLWTLKVSVSNDNGTREAEWSIAILDNPLNITGFNPQNTTINISENQTSHFNITASRNTTEDLWYINGTLLASGRNLTIFWNFDNASFYLVTYNGTDGIDNISKTWNVTVLNINRPPAINISGISMELQNQSQINISANISDPDGDNITITTGDANITVSDHTLIFNYMQTVTDKQVTITVNDSALTANQTIYLNITDTIPPNITINSPQNKTYNTSGITLNFSFDEETGWCAYSLNGNGNITINCTAISNLAPSEGQNNLTLYANDTQGHLASKTVYFTTDTITPDMTLNATNYTTDDYVYINLTLSEAPHTCILRWPEENTTMNTTEAGCFINKTSLNPGTYTYTIYVNDSAGNENETAPNNVTVYYCFEGWSEWSACISRSRSRTYTHRNCQTTTETESCGSYSSSSSSSSFILPVIDTNETLNETSNQTANITTEINKTDNVSINKTSEVENKTGITEENITGEGNTSQIKRDTHTIATDTNKTDARSFEKFWSSVKSSNIFSALTYPGRRISEIIGTSGRRDHTLIILLLLMIACIGAYYYSAARRRKKKKMSKALSTLSEPLQHRRDRQHKKQPAENIKRTEEHNSQDIIYRTQKLDKEKFAAD